MKKLLVFPLFIATVLAQAPPSGALPDNTVVASVEGKDITIGEIKQILAVAPPQFGQQLAQNPQVALAQYFAMKFMAAEGERRKLAEQSPLKEQLEIMRANIIAGFLINQERDSYPVSSEMIDAYMAKNKAQFEQARIKVIQVSFKAGGTVTSTKPEDLAEAARRAVESAHAASERTEAQAEARAKEVTNKARNGADFVKLVAEYSDDASSKASGGDFGILKPDSSLPETFRRAVFGLKAGEVSEPVKMGASFYVVKVEEKVVPPIAEVREPIVQAIRQEHLGEYVNSINSRFKPEVRNQDFFARPQVALGGK